MTDSNRMEEELREHCPVCYDEIIAPTCYKMPICGHLMCVSCFQSVSRFSSLCPVCRTPFCVVKGNQPDKATMKFSIEEEIQLPGYEECGTIIIYYDVYGGIQTERHPKPGQPFKGTSRHAYLPNNLDGQKALRLLKKAFDAQLIFTVGQSITTGVDDVVTWNDIHHKTRIDGGPARYGFPDSTYLTRLIADLAAKGIRE